MKLKLFKKLFLTTSCVLFITLTLVFVLMSVFVNDEFAKNKYDILNESCKVVSDSLVSNRGVFDNSTHSLISSISQINDVDIYVVDNFGGIRICSCDDFGRYKKCKHTSIILSEGFMNGISNESKLELSSIDGLYDKMCYTSYKKTIIDNDFYFYVITVSSVLTATELIKIILGMYLISALLPLVLMFIAEYSVIYRLTRPLKYMSISAKAIAKGDFSKRVPVMSNDEIGELSILFNNMSDSLSRTETTSKSFVANISHELKTPMTTISGFIDGIIDGTIDETKREHYLKIVSDEIKRLSRLVQSMLSLVKLESGDNPLKSDDIVFSESVISVVVSMEQHINDKNIEVIGLDTLTQTHITGDADLLYQVVYNLVDNAVKFTPVGGDIIFSLHRIKDNVEFCVRNTGEGIPRDELPHIFDRFYKIDKSRSSQKDSLGLGLYICKTVVELHGGNITVASKDNEYTEFKVIIPTKIKNGEKNERRIQ